MPKKEWDGSMTTYLRKNINCLLFQCSILIPIIVCVSDHHPVPGLQEPHTPCVASVHLGGVPRGVGHGGAHQPLGVIHQDLESIHVLAINIVDLGVDKVDPWLTDSYNSIIHLFHLVYVT